MSIITLNRKEIVNLSLKTALTIAGMVLLPILVHLVPFSGPVPLGAYLLPMFIAPLVAAYYLSPAGLLAAALLAPVVNHALTGMPAAAILPGIMAELALFSLFAWWLINTHPGVKGKSVLAFVSSKTAVWVIGRLLGSVIPLGLVTSGVMRAIPGLLILLILELLLDRKA